MTQYAVIIERGSKGTYGAYVPDLPGCAAVGDSAEEVRQLIREGIQIYVEELKLRGESVPEPSSAVEYVVLAS